MNDYFTMQMMSALGSANSSGFDIVVLITFCLVSILYVLIPVIGYRHEPPHSLVISLYLLISIGCLSLLHMIVSWVAMPDLSGGRSVGPDTLTTIRLVGYAFAIVKSLAFIFALISFVSGIRSLRLQVPPAPSSSQLPPMAQAKSDYL